jgi:hypothetical protein
MYRKDSGRKQASQDHFRRPVSHPCTRGTGPRYATGRQSANPDPYPPDPSPQTRDETPDPCTSLAIWIQVWTVFGLEIPRGRSLHYDKRPPLDQYLVGLFLRRLEFSSSSLVHTSPFHYIESTTSWVVGSNSYLSGKMVHDPTSVVRYVLNASNLNINEIQRTSNTGAIRRGSLHRKGISSMNNQRD